MAYGNTPHAGPPGWGGWMPPPPPKPGVIPLAPLGLGDVLGGAFATIGRYWKQLFGIAAVVYGAAVAVVAAAFAGAYAAVGSHLPRVFADEGTPAWEDVRPLLIAFGCVWLVGLLAMLLATTMIYAGCAAIVQEAVLGRPTTFGAVWRRARARVPAVIGAVFLTSLILLVPVALFLLAFVTLMIALLAMGSGPLVVPPLAFLGALTTTPLAAWLWVKFSLAPAAAVFEGQGSLAALRRSSHLVRGGWWRIFGSTLLAFGIAAAASYIIQLPVNLIGMFPGAIGTSDLGPDPTASQVLVSMGGLLIVLLLSQLIGDIFVATFPQLVTSLLYVDQRIRKENLAPVLAEAAAVPPAY
ncbi:MULTISPECIES: DUF7847 domain-containing protein [unclassified Streptomyces]|uniref:DUF7847 domain-containing protein n=1 Tax=unclassified Streptomyces TaxID=2593676 RepID=UPI002DDA1B9B|nr:hypothetical protein [Streptomyces sp. NBC_01750]WSD32238.1 hypothetical protein OG966_10170 [Streptomyces sp. NBC_01750]